MSNTSQGNYYKRKTKEYLEKLGYTVQLTEFTCGLKVTGRMLYRKIDIFGSDLIAMNGKELLFVNAKSTAIGQLSWLKHTGCKDFSKYPFPPNVKKQLFIWEPRKKPLIIDCN